MAIDGIESMAIDELNNQESLKFFLDMEFSSIFSLNDSKLEKLPVGWQDFVHQQRGSGISSTDI